MKNCFKAVCAALLLLTGGAFSAFAQQQISGTVVDVAGLPVIGASVIEQANTSNGVVVDLDGKFSITAPEGAVLVVSCIGYVDQEFTVVAGQSVYNVTLSEDNEMLEETVVIGYGTARVRDLTGSVATVSSDDLEVPVANVAEALQGKMAGVVVSMNDGTPGAAPQIRVRGSKSITQNNEPLYIVDGFPVSDLSSVPADQIKSINVLKDAAATAIYGSRGAAGVVLVTTKNALEGQTTVSYNGYVQIKDSSSNIQEVLQPLDYLKFTLGFARDYGYTPNYVPMLDYFGMNGGEHFSDYASMTSHNYQEDLYKTAIAHSHNLTVSNGNDRSKTIFNLNYLYDDGTVINTYYNRINASLKTQQKLNDRLNVEFNISYAYINNRGGYTRGSGQLTAQAYRYRPIDTPMGTASNIGGFGAGSQYVDPANNPVELAWNESNNSYSHRFQGIAAVNWNPIDDLTLRSEIGLQKNFSKYERYNAGYGNETNRAYLYRGESGDIHLTTTASYQIPFKNDIHRADVMIGNEVISDSGESMSFDAYEYPDNFDRDHTFAFMDQYTETSTFSPNYDVPNRSLSFFTRINYSLYDKYLLTLTFRADGSSKFAPNNRWGYFPAAAFAWRLSDEEFMAPAQDWLSNLKVRLSWGMSGSDAINSNLWREIWQLGSNTKYTISDSRENTENDFGRPYAPQGMMQNPNLKWETTISRNLGIDFGFFDERLYGTIEGYWTTTKDLLMPVAVNPSTGYSYQYQNMGVVSNTGLEFSIGGDIVQTSDFTLSANFIYNYNVNRIEELAESVMVNTYGQWASSEGAPTEGEFTLQEGMAIGTIRAYKYLGWYTTEDFNYDPTTGVYTLKPGIPDINIDDYPTSLGKAQNAFPGAAKWEDIDGNGVINEEDTYIVGEMTPRSTGSFNLSARWKNWDLSANFNYVIGGMIMNTEALYSSYGSKDNRFGANRLAFVAGAYSPYRWTSDGTLELVTDPDELDAMNANATMHTPTSMRGPLFDKYLEDASYLRLKSLTLGYTIPRDLTRKIGIENIRAYFTGTNLWTLTGYSGLNPEVNTSRTSGSYNFPTPGIDRNAYPLAIAYTIGLNITF